MMQHPVAKQISTKPQTTVEESYLLTEDYEVLQAIDKEIHNAELKIAQLIDCKVRYKNYMKSKQKANAIE